MKEILLFLMLLLPFFLEAQVQEVSKKDVEVPDVSDTRAQSERFKQSIPKRLKMGKPQKYQYENLWGYILNDSILIPCKYYSLDAPYSDVMVCREPRGLYGAINKKGELVIPYGFNTLEKTEDGLLWGWKTDNGYGLMTLSNKILVPFDYKTGNKRDSFYIFNSSGNQLIIKHLGDEKLKVILEGDFEEISFFNPKKHRLLAVKQIGLWGLMDYEKHIVVPCEYDLIQSIEINKAVVKKGGKTGIIDFEGKVLLPLEYDELNSQLRNGLIPVINKDATGKRRIGLVDSIGQVLLSVEYEQLEQFYNCDLMKVKKDGKWGIVDMKGKFLADIQFYDVYEQKHLVEKKQTGAIGTVKQISEEKTGVFFAYKNSENDKYRLYKLGKGAIIEPGFDGYSICSIDGPIVVNKDEKRGLFTIEGKQIIPFEYGSLGVVWPNLDLVLAYKDDKRTLLSSIDGKQIQPEIYDDWFMNYNGMVGYFYTKIGLFNALHAPDGRRLTPHQYKMGMRKCEELPELTPKLPVGRKIVACTYREIEGRLANIALDDLGAEYEFLVK
jgi:hypothetical protein